jgi:hypothetical protein
MAVTKFFPFGVCELQRSTADKMQPWLAPKEMLIKDKHL